MTMSGISKKEGGFVLTAAIMFIVMLALLAGFVLNAGYNKRILANNVGITRTRAYYRAQAGVVDAAARIRLDYTTGLTSGSFTNPAYNPAPYYLDLDANPPTLSAAPFTGYDVTVDISAVDRDNNGNPVSPLTGRRIIEVTGKDTA